MISKNRSAKTGAKATTVTGGSFGAIIEKWLSHDLSQTKIAPLLGQERSTIYQKSPQQPMDTRRAGIRICSNNF